MPSKKSPGESAMCHAITMEDKLARMKCHDKDENDVVMAQCFEMGQMIVLTIVHNKDKILRRITSQMKNTNNK